MNSQIDSIYNNFMDKLKLNLKKGLFNTKLQGVSKKALKIPSERIIEMAYEYYERNKETPSIYYPIDKRSKIRYSAIYQKKLVETTIGTFAIERDKPEIVNFYQVLGKYGKNTIETYRFGTPISCFKNMKSIVDNLKQFGVKKKKIITISLITPCNTNFCKYISGLFKKRANMSELIKSGYHATLENKIIEKELEVSSKKLGGFEYNTVMLPLSSQKYSGVGHRLLMNPKLYKYEKDRYQKLIKDDKVRKMYDFIDYEKHSLDKMKGENLYKSIVQLCVYYFLYLKDEYILTYHCRSGKDRTSVFDAILQSVCYHLSYIETSNKNKNLERDLFILNNHFYEIIRQHTKQFLLYGLIIAYQSTGIVGLKLKNIPVAHYIFHDDKILFNKFVGNSKKAKT